MAAFSTNNNNYGTGTTFTVDTGSSNDYSGSYKEYIDNMDKQAVVKKSNKKKPAKAVKKAPNNYDTFCHLGDGDHVRVERFNEYHGWCDEMDDLIGREVEVIGVEHNGVRIYHPDNDNDYIFHFKSLELIDNISHKDIKEKINDNMIIGNTRYKLIKFRDIKSLRNILLPQDHEVLTIIFEGKLYFSLEVKLFEQMKIECPRVIGALLSRCILKRSINE